MYGDKWEEDINLQWFVKILTHCPDNDDSDNVHAENCTCEEEDIGVHI